MNEFNRASKGLAFKQQIIIERITTGNANGVAVVRARVAQVLPKTVEDDQIGAGALYVGNHDVIRGRRPILDRHVGLGNEVKVQRVLVLPWLHFDNFSIRCFFVDSGDDTSWKETW